MEKNRSESSDRPRKGSKPRAEEGRDGDMRFVKEGGAMYKYMRISGRWYKQQVEEA